MRDGQRLGDRGHRLHEWSPTGADADRRAISGRLAGVDGQVSRSSDHRREGYPAANRWATLSQLTTFHHAFR
jgi:hypothetical protein